MVNGSLLSCSPHPHFVKWQEENWHSELLGLFFSEVIRLGSRESLHIIPIQSFLSEKTQGLSLRSPAKRNNQPPICSVWREQTNGCQGLLLGANLKSGREMSWRSFSLAWWQFRKAGEMQNTKDAGWDGRKERRSNGRRPLSIPNEDAKFGMSVFLPQL